MRLKRGVVLCLSAPLARVLPDIDAVVENETGREMTITSASDGEHVRNSRHQTGEAIDIRTRDLDAVQKVHLRKVLATFLGEWFTVMIEDDHIHIEFDPKGKL